MVTSKHYCNEFFLSQASANQRLAPAWFLEIAFVRQVAAVCLRAGVCVCPRPRDHKLHSRDI